MFVDTHTHLYASQFDDDRDEMIQRALLKGVTHFFLPNIDMASIDPMLSLEKQYPRQCIPMMGLHPCSVGETYQLELATIKKWIDQRPFCAIGEIGLDYYWSTDFKEQQIDAFIRQSNWAKEKNLPIVIHARDSIDDLIQLVSDLNDDTFRGIFHCFTGTIEQANKIISMGFKLGIGGVLTFKKAELSSFINQIPLDYIVIETDAPYLSPSPFRGKRNESSYVIHIARKLAECYGVSEEEIGQQTTKNAFELFGVDHSY